MTQSDNPFSKLDSYRARQVALRLKAQLALGDEPRYRWLCDRTKLSSEGKPISWRPEILSELGQLAEELGKDKMLEVAKLVCELQPSTKKAIAFIRGHYVSTDTPLTQTLIASAKEHLEKYPLTKKAEAQRAVEALQHFLEERCDE